jgi:uncharacterized protein YggE
VTRRIFGNALSLFVLCTSLGNAVAAAEPALISVVGTVEKSVDPNRAMLIIESWSKGESAKTTQGLLAQESSRIRKVLEGFKIVKTDIQTQNYTLQPEQVWDQEKRINRMNGFRATQGLQVVIKKLDDVGPLLDALIISKQKENFGTDVQRISWDTDQRENVQLLSLGEAVKQARIKADQLAKAAGVVIKRPFRITHATGGGMITPRFEKSMVMADAALGSAPTQVMAGQIEIAVTVSVDYEVE